MFSKHLPTDNSPFKSKIEPKAVINRYMLSITSEVALMALKLQVSTRQVQFK